MRGSRGNVGAVLSEKSTQWGPPVETKFKTPSTGEGIAKRKKGVRMGEGFK